MVNQYYLGDPGRAHRYINTGNPSSAWLKKEFYLDFIFFCTESQIPVSWGGQSYILTLSFIRSIFSNVPQILYVCHKCHKCGTKCGTIDLVQIIPKTSIILIYLYFFAPNPKSQWVGPPTHWLPVSWGGLFYILTLSFIRSIFPNVPQILYVCHKCHKCGTKCGTINLVQIIPKISIILTVKKGQLSTENDKVWNYNCLGDPICMCHKVWYIW